MKSELENEELVRRFLLGDLSESERAEVEDRFFANDLLFQEILLGEDDLIDAYVRGELPAAEQKLFERLFLSTQDGRRRVEFARHLHDSISSKKEMPAAAVRAENATGSSQWRTLFGKLTGNRPALGFAVAAALLVLIAGGLWLLLEKGRSRSLPQREQAERTTSPVEQPHQAPTPLTTAEDQGQSPQGQETPNRAPSPSAPPRTAAVVATFSLLPGTTRSGGGANTFVLPGGATAVRLRLALDGETYKEYRAALSTAEGRKLWERVIAKGSSNESASLTLNVPASLLESGDYIIELSGANQQSVWESVADYSFRIVRK